MLYQFLPVDRVHYGLHIVEKELIHEIQKIKGNKTVIVTTNSLLKSKVYNQMVDMLQASNIKPIR